VCLSRILFLFLLIPFLTGCVGTSADGTGGGGRTVEAKDLLLWENTVKVYLGDNLWRDRDLYDAGHVLMIPLHAAFRLGQAEWHQEFSDHFRRFMENDNNSFLTEPQDLDLAREHYLYLASRFLVLAMESGRADLVPPALIEKLYGEVDSLWSMKTAWWYERDFAGGIRERLQWKLSQTATTPSYYRAITDHEIFLFAISADLRIYERISGKYSGLSPVVGEILNVAYAVFNKYVVPFDDGTWLFQPGLWTDHPDYLYAGNPELAANLKPAPVPGIAEDTSHSHRWPVWLKSLAGAYREGDPERGYYENLSAGLEKQFYGKVLLQPSSGFPAYRVANFMDGNNGVYRYQYQTVGGNLGYGPWELSGILIEGWWGFLGNPRMQAVYVDIAGRFPLPPEVVTLYTGPNTTRPRHPLVTWPDFFGNGFGELNARLAGKF